jgi:hypothetical protein
MICMSVLQRGGDTDIRVEVVLPADSIVANETRSNPDLDHLREKIVRVRFAHLCMPKATVHIGGVAARSGRWYKTT